MHSPVRTRSQAAATAAAEPDLFHQGNTEMSVIEENVPRTSGTSRVTEAAALQAVMEQLRWLREEREKDRQELTALRQRSELSGNNNCDRYKPDNFDGSVPFREFMCQFELIARANFWDGVSKAVNLAASLRGKARSVLEGLQENFSFEQLRSRLELRFGEKGSFQNLYAQFINRKQKVGEDVATYGFELERLVQLAYPECSREVRDKIACAQFIVGLIDKFIRDTLQLEGVISLGVAIERAETIRSIRENGFSEHTVAPRESRNFYKGAMLFGGKTRESVNYKGKGFSFPRKGYGRVMGNSGERNQQGNQQECWNCGERGHFRNECPQSVPRREN